MARRKKEDFSLENFISPDWKPEEAKEEKVKLPGLFDYVKDLSFEKKNLAKQIEEETGRFPSEFVPYVVLKAFGNSSDTVLLANEINIRFTEIPTEAQYSFYLYGIPRRKRFNKFYSEDKDRTNRIKALMTYFNWGMNDAVSNMKMFSEQELKELIRRTDINGQTN